MSIQIFLEGKLLGIGEFLLAPAGKNAAGEKQDEVFLGRSHWISLLSEVLPRALLAELGLAKILLGSSGGGQFLLVLPEESRGSAEAFLDAAAAEIGASSGGALKLLWSITENLGDWSDVRRRLQEEMDRRRGAPADQSGLALFELPPGFSDASGSSDADAYFIGLAARLREAGSVGWSPEHGTGLRSARVLPVSPQVKKPGGTGVILVPFPHPGRREPLVETGNPRLYTNS